MTGTLVEVLAGQASVQPAVTTPAPVGRPLARIDSWLRIAADGTVAVRTGKVEIGMGVDVALRQIVADELGVTIDRVSMTMGDTAGTPDQGGVGASNSIASGGAALRNVAATVRGLLLQAAARRLEVPIDQLTLRDGVVHASGAPARSVSDGDLVRDGTLDEALKGSGSGFSLNVQGSRRPKRPADYAIVGTSVRRTDIADKMFGAFKYVADVRVPKMLHGLVINPLDLTQTLQANIVQTLRRTLREEVGFDRQKVTSVDWQTYPTLRMSEVPPQIDIVIVNRPDVAATGAGEAGTRSVAAAVANAIFDAIGVRLRQVPFTPDRVKAALA